MKTRVLLLILALVVCAVPAFAQSAPNTISFNGFSFSFDPAVAMNVNISQVAGTGPGEMALDAPHTEFMLYSGDAAPVNDFEAPVIIRVYRTADFTGLETVEAEQQELQALLAQRGDLISYTTVPESGAGLELPYLPLANAAQAVRARAQYVDLASMQGVRYLTVFRQDVSPFAANDFVYTFQGLSADGVYYVSAVFRVSTDLFPAEIASDFDYDAFSAGYIPYLTDSVTQLDQAGPASFTPSLVDIDAMLQSFAFGGMPMPDVATAIPTIAMLSPTPTAADVNQDPTLGGLAGTWNLVSYGAPEAQQPVLPNAPVILVVDVNGIGGSGGCNTYGGAFQYNGGAVTFSNIISTLMACEEPIMTQETTYLAALTTATAYQVVGSQLVINYPNGILTFVNAAAVMLTPTVGMTATPTAVPILTETPTATP